MPEEGGRQRDPAELEFFASWCSSNPRAVRACAAAALKHPSISATIIQYGMPLDTRIRRSEFDIESSKNAREHVTVLQAACIRPGEPQLVQFFLQLDWFKITAGSFTTLSFGSAFARRGVRA